MSRWTHAICGQCWDVRHPGQTGYRIILDDPQSCCYCNREATSGLYDRNDPADTWCRGVNGTAHREDGAT